MHLRKRNSNYYIPGNGVRLLFAGKEYFNAMRHLIAQAQESIYLQVYIFSDDETGTQIADALKQAALRNVKVYVMADGYASQALRKTFITDLTAAGVQFRFFEPLLKSRNFYFGRRMHHKVLVTDRRWGLVSGINIADRYNDMPESEAWLDFGLLVEGPVVQDLCILCRKTWLGFPPGAELPACNAGDIVFDFPENVKYEVRMRRNDWVRRKNEITASYVSMLRNAHSHVTIFSSYFLPGKVIRKQLAYAVRRGVKVRVVTTGRSDVMISKYAERWLYSWLLRNRVELYEYQKNVLHGKIATCDDEWMTIGSYNINNISAYASIELNLDVRNATFAKQTRLLLENIIVNDCLQITPSWQIKSNHVINRFLRWLSYQFIRVSLYLFTFYFRHPD